MVVYGESGLPVWIIQTIQRVVEGLLKIQAGSIKMACMRAYKCYDSLENKKTISKLSEDQEIKDQRSTQALLTALNISQSYEEAYQPG